MSLWFYVRAPSAYIWFDRCGTSTTWPFFSSFESSRVFHDHVFVIARSTIHPGPSSRTPCRCLSRVHLVILGGLQGWNSKSETRLRCIWVGRTMYSINGGYFNLWQRGGLDYDFSFRWNFIFRSICSIWSILYVLYTLTSLDCVLPHYGFEFSRPDLSQAIKQNSEDKALMQEGTKLGNIGGKFRKIKGNIFLSRSFLSLNDSLVSPFKSGAK